MEIVKLRDVNMEYEELDKEAIPLLFDALDIKDARCKYCNKKIDKNNFGIITNDFLVCNEIFCQIQGVNDIEDDSEKREEIVFKVNLINLVKEHREKCDEKCAVSLSTIRHYLDKLGVKFSEEEKKLFM